MEKILIINEQGVQKEITFEELRNMVETNQTFSVIANSEDPSPTPSDTNQQATQSQTDFYFTEAEQTRLSKLYLPPHHYDTSFDQLIKRLITGKNNKQDQQIGDLIKTGRFLPHQNLLKTRRPFDHAHIVLADNLDSIFGELKELVVNFQNLVSTSIDFSHLRPKMSLIKSTQGFSSGPVSFIKIYTATLDALRQNQTSDQTPEQTFTLNVHHPDILEFLIFIKNFQKNTLNKSTRFRIELTPQFWEKISHEEDFELINPKTGETVNLLSAKNTFDLIISTMLENPQLGLTRNYQTKKTNHYLVSGLINLSAYENQKISEQLQRDLPLIEQFLEKNLPTTPPGEHWSSSIQVIFTGWAETLIKHHIPYDSLAAIELAESLFSATRSVLGPNTQLAINLSSPLVMALNCSQGMEPIEQLVHVKTNLEGQNLYKIHPLLERELEKNGREEGKITARINETNTLSEQSELPDETRQLFKTAQEIDPDFHLELQKRLEIALNGPVDKKIYLHSPLEQEQIKASISSHLEQGLKDIGWLQIGFLPLESTDASGETEKHFLSTINKNKHRRHREIQPPLFQIKKTEEISLPPIST